MNLKKTIVLLLSLLILVGFSACAASAPPEKDVPLDEILSNIRDAYGDDYIPAAEIPDELLESLYGLTADMVEEVKGEMALVTMHPDRVLVVKAAEGKGDDVETALTNARDNAINVEFQYPMNMAKVNATQIVRHGNYLAFIMLGAIDDQMEDAQSAEAMAYAQEQVQKGVDAFNACFE